MQVVYDANASTTTHNLKDSQNDFTADFTQLVTNGYAIGGVERNDLSSNVVTVSLSEAVTSNGGEI